MHTETDTHTHIHTGTGTTAMTTAGRRAAHLLRLVLTANAATSIAGGAAALVAAGPVADLLGTDHVGRVRAVAAGLLLFGVAVLALARSGARARLAPLVSVVDAAWVAGTVVALAGGWFATRGDVVMAVVGLAVADLAVAQVWLARRSAR